jgi:hypothetical protein
MKILLLLLMGLLIFASACHEKESKQAYSSPEGKVEVTKKKDGDVHEMTVTTPEGTTTMKLGPPDIPKDLGVPIYPGARQQEGNSWSMSGTGKEGKQDVAAYHLVTDDPIDKVIEFYTKKLAPFKPRSFEMNMPTGKVASFNIQHGTATISIVLSEVKEEKGSTIQITKTAQ